MLLESLKEVEIDGDGVFKYIQIRVTDAAGAARIVVRGNARAEYHCTCVHVFGIEGSHSVRPADILAELDSALSPRGLNVEALGGGRIRHDSTARSLFVYGFSAVRSLR